MRRSARSINVCERTDGLWGLPPELMCRVQRGKTWYSGSVGVYCRRTRVKMEILVVNVCSELVQRVWVCDGRPAEAPTGYPNGFSRSSRFLPVE